MIDSIGAGLIIASARRSITPRRSVYHRAGRLTAPVVVVLEGVARQGANEGTMDGVRVVHATRSGDDTIAEVVADEAASAMDVTVVTADRELRDRVVGSGAEVVGPRWLLDRL